MCTWIKPNKYNCKLLLSGFCNVFGLSSGGFDAGLCQLYFAWNEVFFLNNRLYGYGRLLCYVWIHLLLVATKT